MSPFLGTTKTKVFMRPDASSAPTTAASSTAGCLSITASTSAGTTHCPATLKKSSSRPQWVKNPSDVAHVDVARAEPVAHEGSPRVIEALPVAHGGRRRLHPEHTLRPVGHGLA